MTSISILDAVTRAWWVVLSRGILGVLLGITMFLLPDPRTLVLAIGVFVLADGVLAIGMGAYARASWLVLLGAVGSFVGAYTLMSPGTTTVALLRLVGTWASVRGLSEIMTAIRLRKELSNEWMLVSIGVASLLLAVVLFARPDAPGLSILWRVGGLAIVWLIGAYALISGVMLISLALRLRSVPLHHRNLSGRFRRS